MEIKKKIWPEHFEKILKGEKTFDLRLADFNLNKGDILIFKEYNPKTKNYTRRVIRRKVKNLTKFDAAKSYSLEEIKKFGFWEIELE